MQKAPLCGAFLVLAKVEESLLSDTKKSTKNK
jgi:hypothetical protein